MLSSHHHKKTFRKSCETLLRSDDDNRKPWGLWTEFLRHIPHDVFLIMEVSQSSHRHRRTWGETQLFSLTNTTVGFRKNFFHSSFKRIFRWIDKANFFSFVFTSNFLSASFRRLFEEEKRFFHQLKEEFSFSSALFLMAKTFMEHDYLMLCNRRIDGKENGRTSFLLSETKNDSSGTLLASWRQVWVECRIAVCRFRLDCHLRHFLYVFCQKFTFLSDELSLCAMKKASKGGLATSSQHALLVLAVFVQTREILTIKIYVMFYSWPEASPGESQCFVKAVNSPMQTHNLWLIIFCFLEISSADKMLLKVRHIDVTKSKLKLIKRPKLCGR